MNARSVVTATFSLEVLEFAERYHVPLLAAVAILEAQAASRAPSAELADPDGYLIRLWDDEGEVSL